MTMAITKIMVLLFVAALIGYSSGLPEISEADELYRSYDLPHNNWLTPDTFLSFRGR